MSAPGPFKQDPFKASKAKKNKPTKKHDLVSNKSKKNSLNGAIAKRVVTAVVTAFRSVGLSADAKATRATLARSIFGGFLNGLDSVRVELPLAYFDVQSSGSTIAYIYGIQLVQFAGYADWQAVFSQYRIHDCVLHYTPFFRGSSSLNGLVFGGIDYGTNASAPGSVSAVEQLADSKAVFLGQPARWDIHVSQGGGNPTWLDVTNSSIQVAALKMANTPNSGTASSSYFGTVWGWGVVEFKGLQ